MVTTAPLRLAAEQPEADTAALRQYAQAYAARLFAGRPGIDAARALAELVAILDRADGPAGPPAASRRCFFGTADLAAALGWPYGLARQATDALEEAGIVAAVERDDRGGALAWRLCPGGLHRGALFLAVAAAHQPVA
jgi:hypothetical protein